MAKAQKTKEELRVEIEDLKKKLREYEAAASKGVYDGESVTLKDNLQHSPEIIILYNRELKIQNVEGKSNNSFGLSSDEFAGRKMKDVFPGAANDTYRQSLQKALKTGEIQTFECAAEVNGNPCNLEVKNLPVTGEDGNTLFVMSMLTDLDSVKNIEDKLTETEDRYKTLFENAQIGIYRTTPEGKFVLANPTLVKMMGYRTFEELIRRNEEINAFDKMYFTSRFKNRIEETGEVKGLESYWKNEDGSTIFIRENTKAIKDKKGNVLYFEGTVEDITERKKAEEALRVSEERYRILAANMPGTDVHLFDENLKLIIAEGNELSRMGKMGDVLEGKKINELGDSEVIDTLLPQYKAALNGEFTAREFEFNEIWYYLQTFPIPDNEGNVYNAMAVLQNINKRKRQEEVIRRYAEEMTEIQKVLADRNDELYMINQKLRESEQQLLELNAGKDKFFSIIAHDLRSPFTGFLALTEYMHQFSEEITGDELEEISEQMHSSAQNVFSLIENLLHWSRLQMGRVDVEPTKFKLKQKVDNLFSLYEDTASKKEITLENKTGGDVAVYADVNMIDTVFRNLLSNAIKFTKPGGVVTVEAEIENGTVNAFVKDTGIGISDENIEKLFRLDIQFTSKGTQNEKGTGLGLILCREFIEKNGGGISVESKPGEGTTFKVTLPSNR